MLKNYIEVDPEALIRGIKDREEFKNEVVEVF